MEATLYYAGRRNDAFQVRLPARVEISAPQMTCRYKNSLLPYVHHLSEGEVYQLPSDAAVKIIHEEA